MIVKQIPKHVALIMDGNRRWAKEKKRPLFKGHYEGEKRIEPLVDHAIELGIKYLTFWAFSTENWNRDQNEVSFLLNLFRNVLDRRVDDFHKKNVKLNIIGNLEKFPSDIVQKTNDWMKKTVHNNKITLNIALGYGGRDEIIRAIKKWNSNKKSLKRLSQENFNEYLDTAGQPDPDLLIRTGGEMRLSGFLLWQIEYAELYFTKTLWPDFTPSEFNKAIKFYQNRERRYGK